MNPKGKKWTCIRAVELRVLDSFLHMCFVIIVVFYIL